MKRLEKLNIQIFSFHLKTMEMQRRYKFVPGKMFSDIKCNFFQALLNSEGGGGGGGRGGKYRIVMTRSILERKIL